MRKILDLLTSLLLQKECCILLQTLVAEHHDLYIKFGPFIFLWSMRFEAKHRISKISANTSSNRRNICKTLAIKHQLQLNNMFIKGTLSDEIKLGPCSEITDDIDTQAIRNVIQKNSLDSIINCPWISVKGTRYTPKMILTLDICEFDGPNFSMINKYIFITTN